MFEQLRKHPKVLPAILGAMTLQALFLWTSGRMWWCSVGDYTPWSWNIWSAHNSQHVIDPYSFTHILHGVVEFWLLRLLFRKVPLAWRLFIAVLIECTWEALENSTFIIERYRSETISLAYFGDSIINSLADVVCCSIGFIAASKMRLWWSAAFFVATEVTLILWIHDSLVINVIMLLYPIEAIKRWQLGS